MKRQILPNFKETIMSTEDLNDLRKKGFVRVRINGEVRSLEDEIILDKKFKHTIEVVIDRLIIKKNMKWESQIIKLP